MKYIYFFLFLLITQGLSVKSQEPISKFTIPNFNCGVVTRYSPYLIPDNCVQWALNVYFDEDQGVTRRKGTAVYNTTPLPGAQSVRGLFPFTAKDGQRYMIALSSQTLYYTTGDGNWTPINGATGLSPVKDMDATILSGKIWFTNGVDTPFYWDGSSIKTITNAPLGSIIETFRNRIVFAGKAGELSNIIMSKELDGETYATGGTNSVDPVNIPIGGIDAKPIKCMYAGYKDILLVWNEDETWAVYGFGRNDFVVRQLSKEVGCLEDKTVQEKDGSLYWMSRRGLEKMTGQSIVRVSDNVKNIYDPIISNIGTPRYKLWTSQTDWEAGNLIANGVGYPMSATISPGSVVPSTWTRTDTTSADFSSGILVGVSTSNLNYPNSIVLDGERFNDGNYLLNPIWKPQSGVWEITNNYLNLNGESVGVIYTSSTFKSEILEFDIYRHLSDVLSVIFISSGTDYINYDNIYVYIDTSTISLRKYTSATRTFNDICKINKPHTQDSWLHYKITVTGNNYILDTSTGSCSGTDSSNLEPKYFIFSKNSGSGYNSGIDNIVGNMYLSSGTFTSQVFDTTFQTPIGGIFDVNYSTPDGTRIDFFVRSSDWDYYFDSNWTPISNKEKLILPKRYWQYKADLYTNYSTTTPRLDDVTLVAATTGTYIHKCANIGDKITKWGNFQANSILDGGGSITYYISTGTTCDSVEKSTANWVLQTNNAPISISTAPYLGVKEVFSINSATNTTITPLALMDVTVNWQEGTNRPPTASAVYNERYYLSYTSSSVNSVNDYIMVYDKNDAITFLNNINCYSFALYNRKLYCGDANNTGRIYQMEIGEDDRGGPYTSLIRTKAYSFGNPDAEKEFIKMYAILLPEKEQTLDIDIIPSYHIDNSSTSITLDRINTGEDATAGILVSKIPFKYNNNITGRFLDVSFENTGINQAWSLFGLSIYFRQLEVK